MDKYETYNINYSSFSLGSKSLLLSELYFEQQTATGSQQATSTQDIFRFFFWALNELVVYALGGLSWGPQGNAMAFMPLAPLLPSALTQTPKGTTHGGTSTRSGKVSRLPTPSQPRRSPPASFSLFRVLGNLHLLQEACLAGRAHWRAPSSILMVVCSWAVPLIFGTQYTSPYILGTYNVLKMWTPPLTEKNTSII